MNKAQRRVKARATVGAKKQGGIWKAPAKRDSVLLAPFSKDVYNSIEGKEHMFLREGEGTYYTIVSDSKKVGVVGFANGKKNPFLTIGIIKKFRGKGILPKAYDALARKHRFRRVFIDVENTNKESIKAHKEFGFKPTTEKVDKKHYKTDIRMSKEF